MITALTIGNFDGVHVGHAALVRRCREWGGGGASRRVVALCFDPHPATVLAPAAAPARLTTFDERVRLLRAAGAEEVVRLEPTRELLSRTAREFVEELMATYRPDVIVEGTDFHFGKGRAGHVDTLAELGRELGFALEVVEPVEVALSDNHEVRASSTLLRWLISNGRVRDAGAVLGRRYTLTGVTVRGDQRGRTIGFPTANLRTECLLPADGVYACVAELVAPAPADPSRTEVGGGNAGGGRDGSAGGTVVCGAAVNVGTRPTVGGVERRVEAHLLTDDAPAMDAYGWELRLEFVAWVRDQVRFASLDDLRGQLGRDVERVRGETATRGFAEPQPRRQE